MALIQISGYCCERCSHNWVPRYGHSALPIVCPSCKSPYWNVPRRKKIKGVKK